MKRLLGLILVLPVCALLIGAREEQTAAAFDMMLTRTSSGWSATCDTGCSWRELTVTCADGCRLRIDAAGVTMNVRSSEAVDGFGFIVGPGKDRTWEAQSLGGTSWKTIGWRCMTDRCRARIDDSGVTAYPL